MYIFDSSLAILVRSRSLWRRGDDDDRSSPYSTATVVPGANSRPLMSRVGGRERPVTVGFATLLVGAVGPTTHRSPAGAEVEFLTRCRSFLREPKSAVSTRVRLPDYGDHQVNAVSTGA